MKSVWFIGCAWVLLIAQTTLSNFVSLYPMIPNVVLPMVVFLGLQSEVSVLRGATNSFAVGYLFDLACGSSIGLQTFVAVAVFVLVRSVALSLLMRGLGFELVLTFCAALVGNAMVMVIPAIFDRATPFTYFDFMPTLWIVLAPALATTLIGLPIVWGLRRLEAIG